MPSHQRRWLVDEIRVPAVKVVAPEPSIPSKPAVQIAKAVPTDVDATPDHKSADQVFSTAGLEQPPRPSAVGPTRSTSPEDIRPRFHPYNSSQTPKTLAASDNIPSRFERARALNSPATPISRPVPPKQRVVPVLISRQDRKSFYETTANGWRGRSGLFLKNVKPANWGGASEAATRRAAAHLLQDDFDRL